MEETLREQAALARLGEMAAVVAAHRRASELMEDLLLFARPPAPRRREVQLGEIVGTTKSRGTGLGLPTARRLIEAHERRISIACPPGGGTTVLVELPMPPAGAA